MMDKVTTRHTQAFLDGFVDQWQVFATAVKTNELLQGVLKDDSKTAEEKKVIVRDVFGDKLDRSVLLVAYMLIEKGLIDKVDAIGEFLGEMLHTWRDMLAVDITTALPLDAEEEKALIAAIAESTGRDVYLEKHVDASLIGGAVVRIGDKVYDGSLKNRLATLESELLKK